MYADNDFLGEFGSFLAGFFFVLVGDGFIFLVFVDTALDDDNDNDGILYFFSFSVFFFGVNDDSNCGFLCSLSFLCFLGTF